MKYFLIILSFLFFSCVLKKQYERDIYYLKNEIIIIKTANQNISYPIGIYYIPKSEIKNSFFILKDTNKIIFKGYDGDKYYMKGLVNKF
jgi:poly(3-hydroxyalkanoate) synthetase